MRKGRLAALAFWVMVALAQNMRAATPLYFDAGGAVKNWDTTTADWSATSWGSYNQRWLDGADAYFQGTAGQVYVPGTITSVNSINFSADSYYVGIVNGPRGTITLTGAGGSITTSGTGQDTINSYLAGSVGLTKLGAGTLCLTAWNSYTGATQVNAGTLYCASGCLPSNTAVTLADATGVGLILGPGGNSIGSLSGGGASGGDVLLGGTLSVGDSTSTTFAGVIGGGGRLIKKGNGTLTLSGASTFGGTVTISAGTLRLSGGSNRLPTTASVSLSNTAGAMLDLNGQNQTVASLSGGGSAGGNVALGTATLTMGRGSFQGVISGEGNLVVQGPASFTGANTYTGTTKINGGSLSLSGGDNRLPTGTALTLSGVLEMGNCRQTVTSLSGGGSIILNSSTLTFGDATNTTYGGSISGMGSLVKQGNGAMVFSGGTLSYGGSTTITGGSLCLVTTRLPATTALTLANVPGVTLSVGGDQTLASLSGGGESGGEITGVGTITVGDSNSTTFGGVLTGWTSLTKQGTGCLTLTGANSFKGTVAVNGGVLRLAGGDNRLPVATSVTVASGASLEFNGQNHSIASLSGSGSVRLDSGTLTITDNAGTFAGSISGIGGNLVVRRQLTLSRRSSLAGTMTIDGGTLTLSASDLLSADTSVVLTGGSPRFVLNGNQVIASLAGNANARVSGSGWLQVGAATNTTFDGVLSFSGGLKKTGSGCLTVTGANTYTGDTSILSGVLQLAGGANRLPTATALTIADDPGAMLDLNGQDQTVASLSGGGNISLGTGTLTVAQTSGSIYYGGAISGIGGGLVKDGTGAIVLCGANSYTGPTTIRAGVIRLSGGNDRLPTATNLVIGSGRLQLNGFDQTVASVSGGGTVELDGGALTLDGSSTTTYAGAITGSGRVVKAGTGTQILNGANNYTGTTVVQTGTLQVGVAAHRRVLSNNTDIQGGNLVFDYTGVTTPAASVRSNLRSSYVLGGGTGPLTSGPMYTSTGSLLGYGIGYYDNATARTVTTKIAIYGDSDLTGRVDSDDLFNLLSGLSQPGTWQTGDFDYSGAVDLDDLFTLLANLGNSVSDIPSGTGAQHSVVAVPEPSTLVLLAVGLLGLLAVRRRKYSSRSA